MDKYLLKICTALAILFTITSGKLVISPEEIKAIEQLRPKVVDILTHDYQNMDSYLLRWLQAKNLNVKEAAEMLRTAQRWRKDNNIDSIMNETFPEFAGFSYTDDGVDNEGRTVFTHSLGKFDFRKIVIAGLQDRYLRFNIYSLEKAVVAAAESVLRSNGTRTDPRLIGITDFQGFSLRKHACLACYPMFTKMARNGENYYPGVSALSIFVNTPRIALPLIDTYLNILTPQYKETFKVFGTNRTEWTEYLHTIIPPDQLAYQFGGTKN